MFALAVGGAATALILGYAEAFGYEQLRGYCGTGAVQIMAALQGAPLPWWGFLAKGVLTLLTFAGGYKGGEIMPVLAIGACLGAAVADVVSLAGWCEGAAGLGILFAAVGATAFFAACSKCPLTGCILAAQLFGPFAAAAAVFPVILACACSRSTGLYPTALLHPEQQP